ncbi:MAG: D-alanyl-D-alanine carboxypeptidase [Fimbriimonadaceae bacterium]
MICLAIALQATQLDAKLDSSYLNGSVAAATLRTLDGKVLYERLSSTRVMPASNQKILSVSYAWQRLGPDFQSVTRFWKQGPKLIIDAPGNPMLTYDQLKAARAKLGKFTTVCVKQSYRVGVPGGWELDDLPNKYAAEVTALTVDRGSFELWAEGGRLFYLPESYGATSLNYSDANSVKVEFDPFRRFALVSGKVPQARTRLDTLAIHEPDKVVAKFFGGYFTQAKELPDRPADFEIKSPRLQEMATECLVKSDNNIAENLLLMAAASEGPLGSKPYDIACDRLKAFLTKEVGCEGADLRPQDGSGMSRHNFVTTRALARVMGFATNSWGDKWLNALASPGNGTLDGRLAGSGFRGKTGTLDSACALTGVVAGPSGQKLVISMVFNNYVSTNAQVRGIQDEIVRMLEGSGIGTLLEGRSGSNESIIPNPRLGPIRRDWSY